MNKATIDTINHFLKSPEYRKNVAEAKSDMRKEVRKSVANLAVFSDKSSPYALDRGLLDPKLVKLSADESDWKNPPAEPENTQLKIDPQVLNKLNVL